MSHARRVLIADPDRDLRTTVAEQLIVDEEFTYLEAETAAAALDLTRSETIDIILMGMDLKDMMGREAVKLFRQEGYRNPIILLSPQESDTDTVLGFEAGANDVVNKPFRFSVLLARMRAQLRQYDASNGDVFQIGPYQFRPSAKYLVHEKGNKLRLTEKETAVLNFLYKANAQTVPRDVLLREVWGYNAHVTTHTLETHIYRLRQKIENNPTEAKLLITEARGYKLVP